MPFDDELDALILSTYWKLPLLLAVVFCSQLTKYLEVSLKHPILMPSDHPLVHLDPIAFREEYMMLLGIQCLSTMMDDTVLICHHFFVSLLMQRMIFLQVLLGGESSSMPVLMSFHASCLEFEPQIKQPCRDCFWTIWRHYSCSWPSRSYTWCSWCRNLMAASTWVQPYLQCLTHYLSVWMLCICLYMHIHQGNLNKMIISYIVLSML